MAGCRHFLFLGEYSTTWKQTVETVYNQIATDTGIFIEECEHSANFVEQLFEVITTKPFVPNVSFLIYDDEALYEQVLNRITYLTNQKPVFHYVLMALKELNPYNLLPEAPADEWYKEAEHIVSRITKGDTVHQIASYISEELSSSLDEVFTVEMCMKCAEMVKGMM